MQINEVKKIIENAEFNFYGLRMDSNKYSIGDICESSHQLYQDPEFDEEGNLLYEYQAEGPYKGYYDAGELNGTCAVQIIDGNVELALNSVKKYNGQYIYLIAGNDGFEGNDSHNQEIIINDAKVLGKL